MYYDKRQVHEFVDKYEKKGKAIFSRLLARKHNVEKIKVGEKLISLVCNKNKNVIYTKFIFILDTEEEIECYTK